MMPVQHKISNDPKVATLWKGLFLLRPSLSVYAACPCNDRDICATTTAAATLSLSVCKVSAFSCTRRLLFLHRSSPSPPHVGLQRGKTTLQTASISSSLPFLLFLTYLRYVYGMACTKIALFALFFTPPLYAISSFKVNSKQHVWRHTKTLLSCLCLVAFHYVFH